MPLKFFYSLIVLSLALLSNVSLLFSSDWSRLLLWFPRAIRALVEKNSSLEAELSAVQAQKDEIATERDRVAQELQVKLDSSFRRTNIQLSRENEDLARGNHRLNEQLVKLK